MVHKENTQLWNPFFSTPISCYFSPLSGTILLHRETLAARLQVAARHHGSYQGGGTGYGASKLCVVPSHSGALQKCITRLHGGLDMDGGLDGMFSVAEL